MATKSTSDPSPGQARVAWQIGGGQRSQGVLRRFNRDQVVFESYDSQAELRASETLNTFEISINDRVVFVGTAVVSNLVDLDPLVVCEATLRGDWSDTLPADDQLAGHLKDRWEGFLESWEKTFHVSPSFKLLIADIQAFLTEFRLWSAQLELSLHSVPESVRPQLERQTLDELGRKFHPLLTSLFDRFEREAHSVPEDLRFPYQKYAQLHLHPLILSVPFVRRTFTKPLGYAGDYEMVNMILGDAVLGDSLFHKLVHIWFIKHPPAEAHRNRIDLLVQRLAQERLRAGREGRAIQAYSLGCGPAWEVQRFLTEPVCEGTGFTLVDFNQETLDHAGEALARVRRKNHHSVQVDFVRQSVAQVVKAASRSVDQGKTHDFVYCAGLFDYLSDATCRLLLRSLYEKVRPGGLLLVTNVSCTNPSRNTQEYLLEWYLIYRNPDEMRAWIPPEIRPDQVQLVADSTGVNLIMEIRKPA